MSGTSLVGIRYSADIVGHGLGVLAALLAANRSLERQLARALSELGVDDVGHIGIR